MEITDVKVIPVDDEKLKAFVSIVFDQCFVVTDIKIIHGPKGLPKEIVDKIHDSVKKTLEDPAVKKRIEDTGSIIIANTPAQFAAQIAAEFDVYKKVVAAQKLTLE